MIGGWTNTANAGAGGSGDWAAVVNNNYSDLRLYQGIAAPSNGTQMTLSFDYVRPSGYSSTVQVLGMTNGQYVQNWAGGTVQGTSLYTYTMSATSSWTSVTNQGFSVNGTFAHLLLYVSVGGDAGIKLNNVVLSGPGGGGDTRPGHDEQPGHVQPDQHQHHIDLDGPG